MKKFLYHYLNLLIAAFQCFLVICLIIYGFDYNWDIGLIMPAIIVFMVPNILICIFLDRFIRKIDEIWLAIISIFFSPIRVFAQLFTIIRLHILTSQGINDYAERGNYIYKIIPMLNYVLFSCDHPFNKYVDGKIVLSKKEQAENDKRAKVWNEIVGNSNNRHNAILNNKGNLTRPNVILVPLIVFDNKIKYFGAYDGVRSSYYYNDGPKQIEQIARITKLEINGVNYLGTNFISKYPIKELYSPTGLYLMPGTYTIYLEFELKIAPPIYGNKFSHYSIKTSKKLTFKVDSPYEDYYLGLIYTLNFSWTEVRNSYTGQKIEDRNSSWSASWSCKKYTYQELDYLIHNIDPNWYIPGLKIDE